MRFALALAVSAALYAPALAGDAFDARCVGYGTGFAYSEASGFCVKISGRIEAGTVIGKTKKQVGALGGVAFGGSAKITLDARKETELGPVRVYIGSRADF